MIPEVGHVAPDFVALLPGERTVKLADFRGTPLLLIFLRHLA